MNFETLLFILRVVGGLLLLAFVGSVMWFIYRDMQLTSQVVRDRQRRYGWLRRLRDAGEESETPERFPLLPVTSLGRAPGNAVEIDDFYASSEHALVTLRGQQWWLEDLGSRNGTRLNDVPVEAAMVVSSGDVIMIGHTHLKIELD